MEILLDISLEELQQKFLSLGIEKYRAKQIYTSLNQGKNFSEISTVNSSLKNSLMEHFVAQPATILDKKISEDETIKFLFKLIDNNVVETVLMKYKYGYTLCVSTQVGCRMGCKFCASGLGGLIRNLTAGEILGQVIQVNRFLDGSLKEKRKITNIVLMGSGEPLDNYSNVTKFLTLVNSQNGLNISQRNISLSTCGIVPKMKQLCDDGFRITLTVSLHAPTDEIRQRTMPIANKYSLAEIISACRYYFNVTGRRIVFEYVLIKGINNLPLHAKQLSSLLKGLPCHVNVISLNSVEERNLEGTTREEAMSFVNKLTSLGMSATLRRTMGSDISGACGQLRAKHIKTSATTDGSENPA